MSRLENAKAAVEILAILGAGSWALFEYGIKAHEDREEGLHLKRATLELDATETRVDERHAWIHCRLHVKNVSRRTVRTFLINWWSTHPGPAGQPEMSPIVNDPTPYELAPGEDSEIDQTLVVNVAHPAEVVHAHVFFAGDEDGTECRLTEPRSVVELEKMHDQPSVCAGMPGQPCTKTGCPSQAAERLVTLKGETQ